jgi:hypothetical protein
MGTRATTTIYDDFEKKHPLVTIYRQFDGDHGHSLELISIFENISLINGIDINSEYGKHANGMGCLAAFIVSKLKKQVGNIYIVPIDVRETYHYDIYPSKNTESIIIDKRFMDKVTFSGDIKDLSNHLDEEE